MRVLAATGLCLPVLSVALAATATPPRFETEVLPLLQANCLSCHGAGAKQAGLDLSTPEAMLKGGMHGAALVRGVSAKSLLVRRVLDGSMPVGPKKLNPGQIDLLRRWIDAGARGRGATVAGDHWAFRPPVRPQVPRVRATGWVRTPVDAFVGARLEKAGIPLPLPASPHALVRRVFLDVLGVPPTPEEVDAFVSDRTPDAWARLVDGLLARPEYGERAARQWLDVVRYAETNGYERDGNKPQAWRYRDWVVNALNADKPYDRFVTEQLAGDELPDTDADSQIATTMLRLGTWDDEPAEPLLDRYDQLDDIVGTVSASILGVTLRCARCHDHKFEPFSQVDYHRVLACFEPLKRPQDGRTDLDRHVGTPAQVRAYQEADARMMVGEVSLADAAARALQGIAVERRPMLSAEVSKLLLAMPPDRTPAAVRSRTKELEVAARQIRDTASPSDRAALDTALNQLTELRGSLPPEPVRAYVLFEDSPTTDPTHLLIRGNPAEKGEVVPVGLPRILAPNPPAPPQPLARSTGRRLWLARWLTQANHPLTTRVIVNRIWQGHFGEGLVRSANDFGLMGQPPTDRALLDWLATELPRRGWSLKKIHRLILLSSTYRAGPAWNRAAAARDPNGVLIWRWKPRRLDAESVRDAMLSVAGKLNPARGGPSVYPVLPRSVLEGQSRPGDGWGKSDERDARRRSLYIFSKRSLRVPELEILDAPDTTSSCEARQTSTIAPQALTFLNGEFSREQATHLAARLLQEAGSDPAAVVRRAWRVVFSRPVEPGELRTSLEFLSRQEAQIRTDDPGLKDPAGAAREQFCLMLLNSNEFFYLS